MMQDQMLKGLLEPAHTKRLMGFQQEGLIKVMRLRQMAGKELMLNRGQRDRSSDQCVLGVRGLRWRHHTAEVGNSLILNELLGCQMQSSLPGAGNDLDR